ncbi:succinylglutamate desuccinylase/aspartoacylase family protein [Falsiroseomonas oryziterrae]|uniref:succinylglutamate desuccinylase/aspartoacylase family protein n=1 Tax=Falsiroseomonas oryziterrae TaxID=2911368 RepID=UPI001F15FDC3|nr:succinylglutamate desuccinylase/aspartoacylase family protein [Roseomonas sp. NPKOSM-4]
MTDRPTHIWTPIDYARDGKQVDWLHLPHSVTRSAYGTIAIPAAVVKNGEGPTALFTAGNHGDEYEGQVALCNLIRELKPERIRGRVIMIPALNLPAAMAGTRTSPLDEGNLNRSFPGNPDATPTPAIAHYVDSVLFPIADLFHDLHSGGGSLAYVQFASTHAGNNPEVHARGLAALRAFAAPVSLVWRAGSDARYSPHAAMKRGVPALGGEFGGGGSLSRRGLAIVEEGLERLLRHMGIVEGVVEPRPTRMMEVPTRAHFVHAPTAGVFEPAVELGDSVKAGDLCGRVHFVDDPARTPVDCRFAADGVVVCQRHPARVERGDCVAHTAVDVA